MKFQTDMVALMDGVFCVILGGWLRLFEAYFGVVIYMFKNT